MNASRSKRWPIAACSIALAAVAGCASSVIEGQWADASFANRSLLKSRVLVSCRAPDLSLARICDAGVTVLRTPEPIDAAGGVPAVLSAAKALSADSAVISAVSIAANNPYGTSSPWGYPGGDLYGGLGMGRGVAQGAMLGFPLGGVQVATAFSAATTVFEVGNGQELWSVRVPLTGSDDAKIQVARLSGASIDAMRRAGLLGPIATGKR